MGFPKPVTPEQFAATKQKHNHHWTKLEGEIKGREKRIYCRCDLCCTEQWVGWETIKKGRSTRCRECQGKPNLTELNAWILRQGASWEVQPITQPMVTKDGTRKPRRSYWVLCKPCGTGRWMDIGQIRTLQRKRCRSCSSRLKHNGTLVPLSPELKKLRKCWSALRTCKDTKHIPMHFPTWKAFAAWAIASGFKPGMRLVRKSKAGPYSPENCFFSNSRMNQVVVETPV